MTGAIFLATLTTAFYYLTARAAITRPIWSRYPRFLDELIGCAACSGFWAGIGFGWAAERFHVELDVFGATASNPSWLYLGVCAVVGMIWTPILAYAHTYAWSALGADDDNAA